MSALVTRKGDVSDSLGMHMIRLKPRASTWVDVIVHAVCLGACVGSQLGERGEVKFRANCLSYAQTRHTGIYQLLPACGVARHTVTTGPFTHGTAYVRSRRAAGASDCTPTG